jgi:Zn-dependent protease with chaperone function
MDEAPEGVNRKILSKRKRYKLALAKKYRTRESLLFSIILIIILTWVVLQVCGASIVCVIRNGIGIAENDLCGNIFITIIILGIIFNIIYWFEFDDLL